VSYDGSDIIAETVGGQVSFILTGASKDERYAQTDASGATVFLTDDSGSTVALTDASASIGRQYTYDPFGGTTTAGVSSTNTFAYTGREQVRDAPDLYYYRARFYSSTFQRFVSEDPIEFAGGPNLYTYVHDDPINYIDPNGTCDCSIQVKCRRVDDWRAMGMEHCYFVVKGRDQMRVTLTGGHTPPNILWAWSEPWVNGRDVAPGNSPSDRTVYSSVGDSQTCNDVDCVKQKQVDVGAMQLRYRPLRGPNSNTFIAWAAKQCGLSVIMPSSAPGAGARMPK
jgi:RHS repeat-associated protein